MSADSQNLSHSSGKNIKFFSVWIILVPFIICLFHFIFGVPVVRAVVITMFMTGFITYVRLHLVHEKPIVLYIMMVAISFFISMILLFYLGKVSIPDGAVYVP